MKPKHIKDFLLSEIRSVAAKSEEFCYDPQRDFSRKRKLSFEAMLKTIIGMGSKSLANEMIDFFQASSDMPSASAFVQKRAKIKPEALKSVFDGFTKKILTTPSDKMKILAVDGSDIQIATNPQDESSFFQGANGQKPYNLLHLNALYSLEQHIYIDTIIQGRWDWNEHAALQAMVDHSNIPKALVIADRGYESYNTMAHIQEKGWSFLIRIKDGKTGIKEGLVLPNKDEFDIGISLKLTRKQTNEIKELLKDKNHYRLISGTTPFDYLPQKSRKKDPVKFYELNFRVVRFRIKPDTFETVLTNLDADNYPPVELKKLYATRWGIETSFRDLKYTIGMLDFHSKKVMCIHQEVYAHLIMYNFSEMITSHVVIANKQRKHTYKANFSVAVHMCRLFFYERASPPDLETIIARNLIPIRPERHRTRNLTVKVFHGFLYRVA
jgi:hypothetical protein